MDLAVEAAVPSAVEVPEVVGNSYWVKALILKLFHNPLAEASGN